MTRPILVARSRVVDMQRQVRRIVVYAECAGVREKN